MARIKKILSAGELPDKWTEGVIDDIKSAQDLTPDEKAQFEDTINKHGPHIQRQIVQDGVIDNIRAEIDTNPTFKRVFTADIGQDFVNKVQLDENFLKSQGVPTKPDESTDIIVMVVNFVKSPAGRKYVDALGEVAREGGLKLATNMSKVAFDGIMKPVAEMVGQKINDKLKKIIFPGDVEKETERKNQAYTLAVLTALGPKAPQQIVDDALGTLKIPSAVRSAPSAPSAPTTSTTAPSTSTTSTTSSTSSTAAPAAPTIPTTSSTSSTAPTSTAPTSTDPTSTTDPTPASTPASTAPSDPSTVSIAKITGVSGAGSADIFRKVFGAFGPLVSTIAVILGFILLVILLILIAIANAVGMILGTFIAYHENSNIKDPRARMLWATIPGSFGWTYCAFALVRFVGRKIMKS